MPQHAKPCSVCQNLISLETSRCAVCGHFTLTRTLAGKIATMSLALVALYCAFNLK